MSCCINKSSEVSTQFYSPLANLNISQVDETPLNSFSSPRSGSVTVIGKKLCSLSCISPSSTEEKAKFPIPVLSINRVHKHIAQAKNLIKKKSLKIRAQEQPAPVPKPCHKVSSFTPSHKELIREKPVKKKKVEKAQTKPKPPAPLTERSNVRINKILKKSAHFEMKRKRKAENCREREGKKKIIKKIKFKEKNSQIRVENLNKFKSEKFSPRAAWGVDERKFFISEKVLKDIENQREARRKERRNEDNARKGNIGLSKFLEIGEELGFKPRSSSNPIEVPKPASRKEPQKKVKRYIKHQKRKTKEKANDHVIEEIRKETKRMISLKLLDIQSKEITKLKKHSEKPKLNFRPKLIGFANDNDDDIAKIYADKSSEFVFEPESHLKEDMSGFSEDSIQPSIPLPTEYSSKALSAIIKIQHHVRQFLKASKAKRLGQVVLKGKLQKAPQRSESFPSTTQETAQNREEEKTSDHHQTEPNRHFSEYNELNNSLSEAQIQRYQSITEILQSSGNFKDMSFNIDPYNANSYKQELQEAKETKELDFSFSSYVSEEEKSLKKKEDEMCLESFKAKSENLEEDEDLRENSGQGEHEGQEVLIIEEGKIGLMQKHEDTDLDKSASEVSEENIQGQVALVSRASPVSFEEDEVPSKPLKTVVAAEEIHQMSEIIISRLLIEILNLDSSTKKVISIDKDPIPYIDQLIFHVPQKEFKLNLSKPIKRNPLEVLAKMQIKNDSILNNIESFGPTIISVLVFNEIEAFKEENANKELQQAQKFHDRLIFDSCNETLQHFRPFGTSGLPLPWSSKQKIVTKGNYDLLKVIPKVARKIEVLSQFEAGKIYQENYENKGEDGINNLREEKIGLMILQDIKEFENVWVDYEFHEMHSIVDLSNWVLEELMFEVFKIV